MVTRREFPEATKVEISALVRTLHGDIVEWLKAHNLSGGSVAGAWNLYSAVEHAVLNEHEKAQGRGDIQEVEDVDDSGIRGVVEGGKS